MEHCGGERMHGMVGESTCFQHVAAEGGFSLETMRLGGARRWDATACGATEEAKCKEPI